MRLFTTATMMRFWHHNLTTLRADAAETVLALHAVGDYVGAGAQTTLAHRQPPCGNAFTRPHRCALYSGMLQGLNDYWADSLNGTEPAPGREIQAMLSTGVLRTDLILPGHSVLMLF